MEGKKLLISSMWKTRTKYRSCLSYFDDEHKSQKYPLSAEVLPRVMKRIENAYDTGCLK